MQNEIERSVILELKGYFGGKAMNFERKRCHVAPFLDLVFEFEIFKYFIVEVMIERDSIAFSIKEGAASLRLLHTELMPDGNRVRSIIGRDTLDLLDTEIKLRIPDKYLIAKGLE